MAKQLAEQIIGSRVPEFFSHLLPPMTGSFAQEEQTQTTYII